MCSNVDDCAKDHGSFYDIPTEILIMIAKNLVDEGAERRRRYWYKDTYGCLKNLRLTHQRFADLSYINTILFSSIQLEPTIAGLTTIQRGDLSRVAGYARSITFITPPSWALLFETFSYIVTLSALRVCTQNVDKDPSRPYFPTYHFDKSLPKRFVDEHLAGEWPLSETQLRDGYAAYMRDAETTKALLEGSDGQLKAAWVDLLRRLGSRLRKIRFIKHECNELRQVKYYDTPSKSDVEPLCQFGPHYHSEKSEDYGCQRASAIAGDQLFAMVMSCLATSGVAIRWLTINHTMTDHFALDMIPGWEEVDLSSLKTLKFSPRVPVDEHRCVDDSVFKALPSLTTYEAEKRSCEALHALLDKSHASLRYLKLDGDGPITWPGHAASIDMPMLEILMLFFGTVNAPLLRDWMSHMPNLQHLGMCCSHLSKGLVYREWRNVFDAIRDHPNVCGPNAKGLQVELDQIVTCDWTESGYSGLVCRNENVVAKRSRNVEPDDLDDLDDSDGAYERHFYGEVPFRKNHALRYYLQDWDPDDGDSNSDDDLDLGDDDDEHEEVEEDEED